MSDSKIPAWRAVIQYWAYNMDLIHRAGMNWPGFGYSKEEKEQLSALAAGLSGGKFFAFLVLNTLFFIGLAGFVVGVGVMPIATLLDPTHKSGMIFLGCLAVGSVVSLGFGIPATMGFTAVTLNALSSPSAPGAVSEEQAATLYRKMNSQITRMSVIMSVLLIPLVIYGSTQLGGQFLAFVQRILVAAIPFAIVLTIVSAMAPKSQAKA